MTDLERTLPGLLAHHAKTHGDGVALREKRLGVWREVTWREYYRHVRAVAYRLRELGVREGDHVAILSDNRTEWLYADLGAQAIGARSVGIYQTNPPADVAYILQDSGAVVLFCEDQEQVDKAVAVAAETPTVKHVIVFEPRGTRDLGDARLIPWDDFIARGMGIADNDRERSRADSLRPAGSTAAFDATLAELDPTAPAMVVYTSGTTGPPKGAMLSSANVLEVTRAFNKEMGIAEGETVLSYLPLCHVAEKIFSLFLPLTTGAVVHFGESLDTVQADLREVSPTVFLGVPRIWEKMNAQVNVKMQDSSWLKRRLYDYFASKSAPSRGPLHWLGELLVYRPLQERLGLRNCKWAITGAAPISADLIHWYHRVGVPILEGYGQTECAGISHINVPGKNRVGTVGASVPLVEAKLADDGEVLVRGPNVFCGYLNKPDATAQTVDGGWLHTGDIGAIDKDGYLTITGRKKEIIITAGGKNLSPEKIENALKTSPYIKEAISIGDRRKFVGALVQIEFDNVGNWATRRQLPYTSFQDLASKPEVVDLIEKEIDKANELLAPVEQVKAFRLLPKELSQDDGELTATQKVRRREVMAAFEELVESMFKGGGG